MRINDCPKFSTCSAPLCPLDKTAGSHLNGDPVCFYLREIVKEGGRARLTRSLPEGMANQIAEALPSIMFRYGHIKRRLDRAAKSGSRMETFRNPRRQAA
jgi:hypothetical protein